MGCSSLRKLMKPGLLLLTLLAAASAKISELDVVDDPRRLFAIESFGFITAWPLRPSITSGVMKTGEKYSVTAEASRGAPEKKAAPPPTIACLRSETFVLSETPRMIAATPCGTPRFTIRTRTSCATPARAR